MPAKFFQKIENDSGHLEISKVKENDSLKTLDLKGSTFSEAYRTVLRTEDYFSKNGWAGYKITLNSGQHIFCTAETLFLEKGFDVLQAKDIVVGQTLLGPSGQLQVAKVESGKVLCGQKHIYLQEQPDQTLFMNVNGFWLAETTTEEHMKSSEDADETNRAYIYPKNILIRSIKKMLLSLGS